jgi:hypothetical protein
MGSSVRRCILLRQTSAGVVWEQVSETACSTHALFDIA